jgi:hypothetical protein
MFGKENVMFIKNYKTVAIVITKINCSVLNLVVPKILSLQDLDRLVFLSFHQQKNMPEKP